MTATNVLARRKIGQQSVFTATFTDDEGTLTDPSTVTFLWKLGSTETDYVYGVDGQVTKVSPGVYQFTAPVYTEGAQYNVRVKSTGLAAADEGVIIVSRSAFIAP